jgi:uncharacterized protein
VGRCVGGGGAGPAVIRRAAAFLGGTYAFSWGVVTAGWALGAHEQPVGAFVTLFAMMAGPALAAIGCALAFEPRGARLDALGLRLRPSAWWLGAWAIGLALAALSVGFTVALTDRTLVDPAEGVRAALAQAPVPGEALEIPGLGLLVVLQAAVIGPLINAVALTLTEELGWRGYLHHLWRPAGFWRASLATGAVWGAWHAPAILLFGHNYPEHREVGTALFVVFCVLLSPALTLVRDRGGSTVAAGVLHGTINAVAGLTLIILSDPSFPWNGLIGIGGYLALGLGVVAVAAWRWRFVDR